LTKPPDNNGVIQVNVALNRQGPVSPADAAATFIHEMMHARLFIEGRTQNEYAPMLAEARYYSQLLNQGIVRMEQIPPTYQPFIQKSSITGNYYWDLKAVRREADLPPGNWIGEGEYEFGPRPGPGINAPPGRPTPPVPIDEP
jgi:hypothetical protein